MSESDLYDYIQNMLGAAPAQIIRDGKIHRFDLAKKGSRHGWYIAYDGDFKNSVFGSWLTGESHKWQPTNRIQLSPAEKIERQQKYITEKQQRESDLAKQYQDAANTANYIWNKSKDPCVDHTYLLRKKIYPHGIRQNGDDLVIPILNGDGGIKSLQFIKGDGTKTFLPGGSFKGGYCPIGKPQGIITICEGYATGNSIYQSTGYGCRVAFNAGNLSVVAELTRQQYSDTDDIILIAGDDDYKNKINTGKIEAQKAAKLCHGYAILPPFNRNDSQDGTDWNDYSCLRGQAATKMIFDMLLDECVV